MTDKEPLSNGPLAAMDTTSNTTDEASGLVSGLRRTVSKALNRNTLAKCYRVGGAVFVSLALVMASVGCDDDGDDGGDDSTPVAPAPDPGDGDDGGDPDWSFLGCIPNCDDGGTDPDPRPPDPCGGTDGVHHDACQQALDEGWVEEQQVVNIYRPVDTTDELETIGDDFGQSHPNFNDDAFETTISNAEQPPDRGDMANALCAGIPSCGGQTGDTAIQWLLNNGISTGYTGTGTIDDFGAGDDLSIGQVTSFLNRIEDLGILDDPPNPGYHPPVYSYTPPSPSSPCSVGGYIVIAAHVSADDDGCRPPSCDFGRDVDGWCLPPASDTPPVIYVSGPTDVKENGGAAVFRVVLSHLYTSDVDVDVSTSDGTATAGSDYTAVTETVTIAANTQTALLNVPILDDSTYEGDETFTVTLSNPTGMATLSATPSADVTITDNELPTPQNVALVCSTGSAPFTLTATWEGTPHGPLAGADEKVWFLRVNSDGSYSVAGHDLLPSGHTATATVSQEARYAVSVEWRLDDGTRTRAVATAECGDVLDLLTVTCISTSGNDDISLRVNWDASLGSEDVYVWVTNFDLYSDVFHTYDDLAEGSTLTGFNRGTTSRPTGGPFVTFTEMRTPGNLYGDAFSGEPTTYEFSLPNQADVAAASITIPGSSGDLASVCPVPPSVSLSPTALTVAEDAGSAVFTVSLSTASPNPVSVDVNTSDGTATAGSDYTAIASRTVIILPGETTATVSVAITDDTATEPDETFTVTLSNPTNATLGTATATATITNDDQSSNSPLR